MFEFKYTKTFMDAVHGYIIIPKCFVDNIIDTEYFQRLRNIDQTGMRILYPDGKHDRFGHSLGVFYLGCKAVDALLANFSQDKFWNIYSNNTNNLFWAKNKVLFLIACLLHDIGHVPFSHSLESLVYNNTSNVYYCGDDPSTRTFTHKLVRLLNQKEGSDEKTGVKAVQVRAAAHEQFGAGIVLEKLEKNIQNIFTSLIQDGYPNSEKTNFLFAEHLEQKLSIEPLNGKDLGFIARMILGLPYDNYKPEFQIRNCFIELLNGSNFDVDKLDYILRDTQMSGMSNIAIDVERLLKSICVITQTVFVNYNIESKDNRFQNSIIHTIESQKNIIEKSSDSEYSEIDFSKLTIDGHIKGIFVINPDTQIIIKPKSTFVFLGGEKNNDLSIVYTNDESPDSYFDSKTSILCDSVPIEPLKNNSNRKRIIHKQNNNSFTCKIDNATLLENDFEITACSKGYIEINGYCNIELIAPKGATFKSKSSVTLREDVEISGKVGKIIALSNLIEHDVPNNETYNSFKIGYKKQSMNLLANVLEGRDYLYLWCYAHHKVIYYANFLIPILAQIIKGNNEEKKFYEKGNITCFHTFELTYDNLLYLDDSYVWTILRYIKNENSEDNDEQILLKELFTHKYKNSIWKSLSEYDLLFEAFNANQQLSIRNFFQKNIDINRPRTFKMDPNAKLDINFKTADNTYCIGGFIRNEFLVILKTINPSLDDLADLVFVDAGYTQKDLSPHDTFITINNEVIPMDRIGLLTSRTGRAFDTSYYFYLYYGTKSGQRFDEKIYDILKRTIKNVLTTNLNVIEHEDALQHIILNYK